MRKLFYVGNEQSDCAKLLHGFEADYEVISAGSAEKVKEASEKFGSPSAVVLDVEHSAKLGLEILSALYEGEIPWKPGDFVFPLHESDELLEFLNEAAQSLLMGEDAGTCIESVLQKTLTFFNGKRAYVFELDNDSETTDNTYEVCASGVSSEKANLQGLPLETVGFWLNEFKNRNYISISNVNLIDGSRSEERRVLSEQGIESLIAVPLRNGGELIGFFGVDDPERLSGVERLSAIGDYVAAMIVRRDMNAQIEKDSEAIKTLLDDMPGGFCKIRIDSDTNETGMIYANDGFCKLTGMTHAEAMELYSNNASAGVHPDDIPIIDSMLKELAETGEMRASYRLRHGKDGYVPIMVFGRLVKNDDGESYLNAYYTDITEQIRIDEQRKELLDNLPCGAALYSFSDGKMRAVHLNKRYSELVNRDTSKPAQLNVFGAIHPDDRIKMLEVLRETTEFGKDVSCVLRIQYGENEYRRFRAQGSALANRNGEYSIYVTYTPITDREMTVQETVPVVLAAIMESSTDLSFAKDKDFKYVCCSRAFAHMAGLADEGMIEGKTDYDIFPEKMADKFRQDDITMIQSGQPMIDMVEEIPSGDGMNRYSSTSKYLLRDTGGRIIGIYGVGRDITEYRTAFEQLKILADNIPGGLATVQLGDGKAKMVYYTEGFYKYLGYDKGEYDAKIAEDFLAYIYPEDRPAIKESIKKLVCGESDNAECTYRCKRKDSVQLWMKIRASVSERHEDKVIVSLVKTDITREKLAVEAERIHSEEMSIAIAQIGKMIFEFNPATLSLSVPERYAKQYGLPRVVENAPTAMLGLFSPGNPYRESIKSFFKDIVGGKKSGSTTIHVLQPDGSLRWERCEFVTIFGDDGKPYKTIISNEDITDYEETKRRYEHEVQLRRELVANSIVYFEINLTANIVEEYSSSLGDVPELTEKMLIDDVLNSKILYNIDPKYRLEVKNKIFAKALNEAYARGETSASVEYRRAVADKGYCWVRAAASIMKRPDTGDVIAFIFVSDIDREKKNRLALNCIVDEEIEAVCIVNAVSGIAHMVKVSPTFNLKVDEDFNYCERINQFVNLNILLEEREECGRFLQLDNLKAKLETEPSAIIACRYVSSSGEILRKRALVFYLDGSHEEIVISYRDITGLYEEEQRQNRALQTAVDAANKANRAKSDFLSRMSHDMRTPLNAVLSFSNTEMTESVGEQQLREYLNKINYSGEYLLGIINDVLDMSKIEQKKITLNPVLYSMSEFEHTIKTVIGELSHGKNIEFILNSERAGAERIIVDKVRFNQIFVNLLSNAVKFTPDGGRVELIVEQRSEAANCTNERFIVRDTGVGMSPEFLPHAFESFSQEYRKDAPANNQGTGLGLAIVKEIVTLMGGTVSVESELGKGTQFTVELSLQTTAVGDTAVAKPAEILSLKGTRVLLCEDNPMNTEIAVFLLEKQGCEVVCATDGAMGVKTIMESPENYFDTVLMDIRMPVMNGIEAAKAIRALDRSDIKSIPIIAMTADAFLEDEQLSHNAGMDDHLTKPIEPQKLYDALMHYIHK